jgi:CRISPR-associated endonuclease/helicase Cas3
MSSSDSVPTIPLDKCIAKRKGNILGIKVIEHCVDVAMVAESLYQRICPTTRKFIFADFILWAAFHDVGKVSPGFQKKIYKTDMKSVSPELDKESGDLEQHHACVSEVALMDIFGCKTKCRMIAGHHGVRDHEPSDISDLTYGGPAWQKIRKDLVDRLVSILGGSIDVLDVSEIAKDITLAHICLSDWIGSNKENFDPVNGRTPEESRRRAEYVVGIMDWLRPKYKPNLSFEECFKNGKGSPYHPNDMQKRIEEMINDGVIRRGSVCIVEGSTGRGKTEVALRIFYRLASMGLADGLYFGLPTRFTSNNMHSRVVDFLDRVVAEGSNARLIHGEVWRMDNIKVSGQLSPGGAFYNSNRRAVIEPFGVGTADQALLAVLKSKFYFVRQFGLVGKVVILDEVHSYDIYTSTLMTELIRKLIQLECTVIVMSATLTGKAKSMILGCGQKNIPSACRRAGYPRLTIKNGDKIVTKTLGKEPRRIVKIKHVYNRDKVIMDTVDKYEQGATIVWVENIVGEIVRSYNACMAEMVRRGIPVPKPTGVTALPSGVIPIGILHSTLRRPCRSDVEGKWTKQLGKDNPARPFGCILFATQVIEQSLDLDCDIMVTNIAPSDFLIQRMGRCGRHMGGNGQRGLGRPSWWKRPEVWIISPYALRTRKEEDFKEACGKSGLVYNLYTLWRTYHVWKGVKSITCPRDVRSILSKTYRRPISGDPKWVRKWWKDSEEKRAKKYQKALLSVSSHEAFDEDEFDQEWTLMPESGKLTRLAEVPTVQIVLCRSVSVYQDRMEMSLFDGQDVTVYKDDQRVPQDEARRVEKLIADNMVKVPRTKGFNDEDDDPENPSDVTKTFLKEVIFGHPMAVIVNGDKIHRCDGSRMGPMTEYNFDDEHGAYRRDYIQ